MSLINLTPEQIKIVEQHVRKAQLNFSHLEDDLIDHMCCYIEELLNKGQVFEKALENVKKEVGLNMLKTIEIETIILINQKLKAMKTTLKFSGIAGIILLFTSAIFKIQHWPGAPWLMLLGVICIVFAYMPALLLTVRKEKIKKSNLALVYSGVSASFFLIATWMFNVNHWPYQDFLRLLFWLSSFVFLGIFFFQSLKQESNRLINLSAVLILTFMLLSNITSYSISKGEYSRMHLYTAKDVMDGYLYYKLQNKGYYTQIKNLNDSIEYDLEKFKKKGDDIIESLNKLRNAIYETMEAKRKDNYKVLHLTKNRTPMEEKYHRFGQELREYRDYLGTVLVDVDDEPLMLYIEESLAWHKIVTHYHDVIIHNSLNRLERDIYICQNQILQKELIN